MRILFYSQSPDWNGSARAMAAAARGMSERGHNVTVVCRPKASSSSISNSARTKSFRSRP